MAKMDNKVQLNEDDEGLFYDSLGQLAVAGEGRQIESSIFEEDGCDFLKWKSYGSDGLRRFGRQRWKLTAETSP